MVVCAGLLAGLLSVRVWQAPSQILLLACALAVGLMLKKSYKILPLLFVTTLFIGSQRGSLVADQLSEYDKFYKQEVTVAGSVSDDPSYDDRGQTEFHVSNPTINGQEMIGRVRVRSFGASGLGRGDQVNSEGKLYPGFGNRQGSVSFAETDITMKSSSPFEAFRTNAISKTYSVLPEPQASLGLGFLVGIRSLLPDALQANLATAGLTHIVVASGYNLTVLVRVSQKGLGRISHRLALIGALIMIVGFLAITGLSPSIVRASAVSGLALTAAYFGRPVSPYVLILVPAAVTAYINPLYLWSDLGWWLSFLAFTGVLVIAPLLSSRIYRHREPGLLGQVLIETTSAQVMALPLIMVIFGELSVVSFLANALVVPLVPLAMLLTFIAMAAGLLSLTPILALPASLLLSRIVNIVNLVSLIPGALRSISLTWHQLALIYLVIALAVLALNHSRKLYLAQSK